MQGNHLWNVSEMSDVSIFWDESNRENRWNFKLHRLSKALNTHNILREQISIIYIIDSENDIRKEGVK